jgi:hypothetical protein
MSLGFLVLDATSMVDTESADEFVTNAVFAHVAAAPAGRSPSTTPMTTLAAAVADATTVAIPRLIQIPLVWFEAW